MREYRITATSDDCEAATPERVDPRRAGTSAGTIAQALTTVDAEPTTTLAARLAEIAASKPQDDTNHRDTRIARLDGLRSDEGEAPDDGDDAEA